MFSRSLFLTQLSLLKNLVNSVSTSVAHLRNFVLGLFNSFEERCRQAPPPPVNTGVTLTSFVRFSLRLVSSLTNGAERILLLLVGISLPYLPLAQESKLRMERLNSFPRMLSRSSDEGVYPADYIGLPPEEQQGLTPSYAPRPIWQTKTKTTPRSGVVWFMSTICPNRLRSLLGNSLSLSYN